jgi:chromate reductase
VRILGLVGSVRRDSHNRRLLRAAEQLMPGEITFGTWSALADLPAYDEDLDADDPPAAVIDLRLAIARADALVVATPEYNSSVPGALENVLDWASRPYATNALRGKPVAVVGAGTGVFGAVWAQAELRKILRACGAGVLDRELAVGHAAEAFTADGAQRRARSIAPNRAGIVQPPRHGSRPRAGCVVASTWSTRQSATAGMTGAGIRL